MNKKIKLCKWEKVLIFYSENLATTSFSSWYSLLIALEGEISLSQHLSKASWWTVSFLYNQYARLDPWFGSWNVNLYIWTYNVSIVTGCFIFVVDLEYINLLGK